MDPNHSQWIKCLLHRVDLDKEYTLIDLTVLPRKGERFIMEDVHGENEEFIVTEVLHRFTALKKQLVEIHIQPLSSSKDSPHDSSTFPKRRPDVTNQSTDVPNNVPAQGSSFTSEPENTNLFEDSSNTPLDHQESEDSRNHSSGHFSNSSSYNHENRPRHSHDSDDQSHRSSDSSDPKDDPY